MGLLHLEGHRRGCPRVPGSMRTPRTRPSRPRRRFSTASTLVDTPEPSRLQVPYSRVVRGRDRAEIETSLQVHIEDVSKAIDVAAAAGEAGADHVIFYLPPPADISLIDPLAEAAGQLT